MIKLDAQEILQTEPQTPTDPEGHEEPNKDKYIPPSLPADKTIDIKFPLTDVVYNFTAQEIQRGRIDLRWKYPSPCNTVNSKFTAPEDKLQEYNRLISIVEVVDIVESHINQICQLKWKQATKDCAGNVDKSIELFSKLFSEAQTKETTSADGLSKMSAKFMKAYQEEKQKFGLTDKAKEFHGLFKRYNELAKAKLEEDMLKMLEA